MIVTIEKIIKNIENGYKVYFSNQYGNATAIWNGDKPLISKEYYAEIEVTGVLIWEKDIFKSDKINRIEELENGKVGLYGVLESIEDDGYAVVRIGDSIVAIETQDVPLKINSCVMVSAENILLYKVDY